MSGISFSHCAGMAYNQVALEFLCLLVGDYHIGKFAKSCSKSVDHRFLIKLFLNVGSGLFYGCYCLRGKFNLFVIATYADNFLNSEVMSVYDYCHAQLSISFIFDYFYTFNRIFMHFFMCIYPFNIIKVFGQTFYGF